MSRGNKPNVTRSAANIPHYGKAVLILLVSPLLCATPALAQRGQPSNPLDQLVEIGLERNLGRRQRDLAVRRAEAAVRQARGLYLPSATVNARYSQVSGNVVDLGAVVNPALGALNQILQRPAFPTDLDLRLPQTQETTLRVTQPVFQPQIVEANRIANALADAQTAERASFTRQLAADIRSGYLNYAKASRLVALYDSTLPLLDENLRVSERLVAAGKATPDAILRARAERSDVVQKRDEANQSASSARQSLNFLLDHDLESPVALIPDSSLGFDDLPDATTAARQAVLAREELRVLDHAMRVSGAQERAALSTFLPTVALALDYGFQGNEYRFDSRRDHTIASVVLSWNVFNGGQDVARARQASVEHRRLEYQRSELERLVTLQVRTAWDAAQVARSAISTAGDRLESARRTFELVRRRHEAGSASQIEFLDARTTYTSAALNQILTTYDYYLRRVAFDRAAASYPEEIR
ncbi:MAG: TolC family protein [Gemmatimonadaceae bacterium]